MSTDHALPPPVRGACVNQSMPHWPRDAGCRFDSSAAAELAELASDPAVLNLAGTPHHWAQPSAAGAAGAAAAAAAFGLALALASHWWQPRHRCSRQAYEGICSHQFAHSPSSMGEPSPCSR